MSSTDPPLSGAFATGASSDLSDPVQGPFEVLEVAPSGGMGIVVHARDRTLDRDVAIKRARPDVRGSEDRLQREARVLGQLDHPAIVRVFAAGTDPLESHAGFRMVLDWIGDGSLADVLGTEAGTRTLADVAAALAHAHDRGFVHRDLKPSNIRLADADTGRAVLIDWGLARRIGEPADPESADTLERRLTQTGTTVGTPGYMAPEQALHAAVAPTCDIWAFGVLLRQHLTGTAPSDASHVLSDARQTDLATGLRERFGPLGQLAADCLQRDPADRPPDGTALLERFTRATADAPVQVGASGFRVRIALGAVGLLTLLAAATLVGNPLDFGGFDDLEGFGAVEAPPAAASTRTAEEAFVTLAWQAVRSGRDEEARQWARAVPPDLADPLPTTRGLAWLPAAPPPATTLDTDCPRGSLARDGSHLLCLGKEEVRLLDPRTGEERWSDRIDVGSGHATSEGAVLRSGGAVLLAGPDGRMETVARTRPNTEVQVANGHVVATTGKMTGTRLPDSSDITEWREIPIRTRPEWDSATDTWVAGRTLDVVRLDPESLEVVFETPAFASQDLVRVHASDDGPLLALGIRGELTIVSRSGEVLRRHQLGPPVLLTSAVLSEAHVAIASPTQGIQVYDVATGGWLGQLSTGTSASLAFDEGHLVWLEDGQLHRRVLPTAIRGWHVPGLASGAWVDGRLAMAGNSRIVELVTGQATPTLLDVEPNHTIKDITWFDGAWVAANTTGYVKRVDADGITPLGRASTHRDVVPLADGSLLALPYENGPIRILPDGSIDLGLERPEPFISAIPDAGGSRVGLVTSAGDVFGVQMDAEEADIDRILHHPGARFALPVDSGWLVIDATGAWPYDPTGEALASPNTPAGTGPIARWTLDRPVTTAAVGRRRCVLGDLAGRVAVHDCASGEQLGMVDAHTERIAEVLLSPDETVLYTASWDEQVHRFDLPTLP